MIGRPLPALATLNLSTEFAVADAGRRQVTPYLGKHWHLQKESTTIGVVVAMAVAVNADVGLGVALAAVALATP